jgi:hypothetical protein
MRDLDGVIRAFQPLFDHGGDPLIVLDHQDFHFIFLRDDLQ